MKQRMMATALLVAASVCVGCQSKMGNYPGGHGGPATGGCSDCGVVSGGCPDCARGPNRPNQPVEPYGADVNYLPNEGRGGVLAALHGRHHRGPQSHTGQEPGPAMGPSHPSYGYPYYTTRGPRDFLNPNPPSIGR